MTDNLHDEQEIEVITYSESMKIEEYEPESGKLTRLELLKITGSVIQYLKKKATVGRFADQDLEKLRDSKMILLLEACKVHASVLKDEQTDELEKRIEALEGVGI